MHIDKSKVEVPGTQSGIRYDESMIPELSVFLLICLIIAIALLYKHFLKSTSASS